MSNHVITGKSFEKQVAAFLRRLGAGLPRFSVKRLEKLSGADGTYEIDVVVRLELLGASIVTLVECKKHRSAIKRDVVQVLYDRLRAVGAHKGLLFSTGLFQSGAIEYARAHGIALVQLTEKGAVYITKLREHLYAARAPAPRWLARWLAA